MTARDLATFRQRIDAIDAQLCAVLQQRAALCRAIGTWKRANGVPAVDPAREAAMLSTLLEQASDAAGFDRAALERILRAVFAESRAVVEQAVRGG